MNKEELVELLAKSQDAILERVDSKLQELRRSISEDQEQCLSSVVKRVKEDNFIKWKKVGKEKQFKLNQSVEARFDSDISAIEKKKLDKAKKELEEVHASTLSSPFDCSPFSFDKPHFCPDLSSGEAPASLVDREVTVETTAPISFLQEDQISQPSVFFLIFILKSLQILVCLKLAPSGNTLIFGPIPFAPPTLSLTLL